MSARPLALAFIGGALDSAVGYTHYSACRMDGRWQLVAGAFSEDPSINRDSAKAYGVATERVYDDWSEMIRQEQQQLDAVVILTPTPSHQSIVCECLAQGIAVICEKALAASSREIEQILATRDKQNGFLAVTYNYSGYPMLRELRSLIRSGKLGRILHFQAEMPQEGFRRVDNQGEKPIPQAWRLHDGEIPTIYLDLAVHLHQLIHYLTAQHPLEVVADQANYGWFDVIDNVSCLCRYSEQIMGQIWFSKAALGHRNGLKIRIYGSDASAEWLQTNPEELLISHADGRRQILDRGETTEVAGADRYSRFKAGHPAGFIEAFANLYQDIANGLTSYQQSSQWHSDEVFSGELALEGTRMFEAMISSFEQRQWVSIAAKPSPSTSRD